MNSLYRKIDVDFLDSLDLNVKERLEKQIQPQQNRSVYFKMCPYCGKIYSFHLEDNARDHEKNLKTCRDCGRSDPFEKIEICNKHNEIFLKLMNCKNIKITSIENSERLILEQYVVNLTTGIEIYLREFVAIWKNLLNGSINNFENYYNDTKLTMFDETKRRNIFKNLDNRINLVFDSNINFKLGMMFNIRNIIVHNFGLADEEFINKVKCLHKSSTIPYTKGKKVSISIEEINEYSSIIHTITEETKTIFNQFWSDEITKRITSLVNNEFKFTQYIDLSSYVSSVGYSTANAVVIINVSSYVTGQGDSYATVDLHHKDDEDENKEE